MLIHKLKLTMSTLLLLGAIATATGYLTHARAMKDEPQQTPTAPQSSNPKSKIQNPKSGRMFVVGRVLDPAGKPVPNATTMVYARSKAFGHSPSMSRMNHVPIGDTRADGSGRFRIDAPRTSSSRYDQFGAAAIAPGHGVGWVDLDPDADEPTADITLRPEQVIQGRLSDLQGRPAAGVTVSVRLMGRVSSAEIRAQASLGLRGGAASGGLALPLPGYPRGPSPRSPTPKDDSPSAASDRDCGPFSWSMTRDSPHSKSRSIRA